MAKTEVNQWLAFSGGHLQRCHVGKQSRLVVGVLIFKVNQVHLRQCTSLDHDSIIVSSESHVSEFECSLAAAIRENLSLQASNPIKINGAHLQWFVFCTTSRAILGPKAPASYLRATLEL